MKRATPITPGEFELMEILWVVAEGSVKEVLQRLDPQRHLAYTTVMTVLEKMRRKGLLKHRKIGKAFFYTPTIPRNQALAAVVNGVVESYFHGSRADFVQFVTNGSTKRTTPQPLSLATAQAAKDTEAEFSTSRQVEELPIEDFLL